MFYSTRQIRYGELELYSDRLIPLAVTLTSLCRSPAHYYDYDLLGNNHNNIDGHIRL